MTSEILKNVSNEITNLITTKYIKLSHLQDKLIKEITEKKADKNDELQKVSESITKLITSDYTILSELQDILVKLFSIENQIKSRTSTAEQLSKLREEKKKLYKMMSMLPDSEFNSEVKTKYAQTLENIKNDKDAPEDLKNKLNGLSGGNPTERSWLKFFGL
jgi:predicted  nucleic acid-binding Zn-ribbon protein